MTEYYVHPTSIIDEGVEIGEGTKIWHFSHIQSGAQIGKKCSLGQNVNVSNNVKTAEVKLMIANIYFVIYKQDNAKYILKELDKLDKLK